MREGEKNQMLQSEREGKEGEESRGETGGGANGEGKIHKSNEEGNPGKNLNKEVPWMQWWWLHIISNRMQYN
jgi:hypothetical protein